MFFCQWKTTFYSRKLIQKYERSAVTFLSCVLAEMGVKEGFALLGCYVMLIDSGLLDP
jgi:hypothetical protein